MSRHAWTAPEAAAVIGLWVGLVLAGCGGEPRDGSPDAQIADDAGHTDDAGNTDDAAAVRMLAPFVPELAGLCAGTPVETGGQVAWVSDQTLWLSSPARDASISESAAVPVLGLSATASARSPVVLGSTPVAGTPRLALAVDDLSGATLHILDPDGAVLDVIDRPTASSLQPLAGPATLVWPLHDRTTDTGRALWVDLVGNAPVFEIELLAIPTTPAVVLGPGLRFGGGSHWLVGTDRGLVMVADRWLSRDIDALPLDPNLITDPPTVVARLPLDSPVVHLLPLGDHVALTRRIEAAWVIEVYRLAPGEGEQPETFAFTQVGTAIPLPGPPTAHPVARACGGRFVDPAGTFCPPDAIATLVIGGDGWLEAHHLGLDTTVALSDAPLVWTGLAIGEGGWVAGGGSHWIPGTRFGGGSHWIPADDEGDGGGSHWLPQPVEQPRTIPPGWQVFALHMTEPSVELAAFTAETDAGAGPSTCIPSPVWDTDGTILLPIARATTTPLVLRSAMPQVPGHDALAVGFPRPHGTNQNKLERVAVSAECSDGTAREFHRIETTGAEINGFAHGALRSVMAGHREGSAFVTWLPGVLNATIEFTLENTIAIDRMLVTSASGGLAMVYRDRDGESFLETRDRLDMLVARTRLDNRDNPIVGLVRGASPAAFVIAIWPNTLQRVETGAGTLDSVTFEDSDNGPTSFRLLPDRAPLPPDALPGGAVMVVASERGLTLRRVDGAFTELALTRDPDWAVPVVTGASIDAAGHVRLIVEDVGRPTGPPALFRHYDANLELVRSIPLPHGGSLATTAAGDSLVAGPLGLFRIGRDGHVGLPYLPRPGLVPLPGFDDAVLVSDNQFAVAWSTTEGAPGIAWGRTDALGFATCFSAGACLGRAADSCDGDDVCVASGCEPATGLCQVEPLPGCEPP